MSSSAPSAGPFRSLPTLRTVLAIALLVAGCAREAPEVREVRVATKDYLKALQRRDMKQIAERSTCLVSTNSFVGGRVLAIEPSRWVRAGDLDSLVLTSMKEQRVADREWAYADESSADSLFRRARALSEQAAIYRNAVRAIPLSSPGVQVGRDSTLEIRTVRARFRYAGPVIGPRPVDHEQIVRLLRAGAGHWVVFTVNPRERDPVPDLGRPRRV